MAADFHCYNLRNTASNDVANGATPKVVQPKTWHGPSPTFSSVVSSRYRPQNPTISFNSLALSMEPQSAGIISKRQA